jgi:aminopeptidase N
MDKINPQVAARMAGSFTQYKAYDAQRQAAMQKVLQRLVATEGLSENVFEIVTKSVTKE